MSKNITFSISKHYFIYFHTSLYNTTNIKGFFFFYHFIKILFILIKWERESRGKRHNTREWEREKEKIIIKKSSNLLPSKMTLHCNKDVKNFKNSILDMDDILRG